MKLNLSKCFTIDFSLKRQLNVSHSYLLEGSILSSVPTIKDLVVFFTRNLCFTYYVSRITKKDLRIPGYIKRTMKVVKNVNVLKILYNAYVRSTLDCCSPV